MHQHVLPWFIWKKRKSFLSLYLRRTLCCSCFSYQVDKDHLHRLCTNYENVSVVAAGIVGQSSCFYQIRPISLPSIHSSSLFSGENQRDTFPRVMKWHEGASEEQLSKEKKEKKLGGSLTTSPFLYYTSSIILVSLSNNSLQRHSDDMHSVSINYGLVAEMASFLMSTRLNQQWI